MLLLMVAVAMSWFAMGLVDGEFPRPKIQAFKLYSEFRSTRDHIFQFLGCNFISGSKTQSQNVLVLYLLHDLTPKCTGVLQPHRSTSQINAQK